MSLAVPVVLLIYRRPELTALLCDAVRTARPRMLLVVADGPRTAQEAERCRAARAVVEAVPWECEVLKHYADTNLGCGVRVSTGLDWCFSQVEEAIILEDDCLPCPAFFRFCEELLGRYRGDPRVMMISGDNFIADRYAPPASYYFSRYVHCWGWATWRRAWQRYSFRVDAWPALRASSWLRSRVGTAEEAAHWRRIFDLVHAGRIDTWDYQWVFACWAGGGLAAVPGQNLVTNLGFGPEATHTRRPSPLSGLPVGELRFPLVHPERVERDLEADRIEAEKVLGFSSGRFPWAGRLARNAWHRIWRGRQRRAGG